MRSYGPKNLRACRRVWAWANLQAASGAKNSAAAHFRVLKK
jgi:hypothetical protein